jgi:hypothetical protein
MSEPTIVCPNCKTEIKLNESLAAPLIAATRQQYEQKMAAKDADVAKREAAIREQQENLHKEKEAIEEQVSAKLKVERDRITIEEVKKAKLLAATDLEQKTKEIADLELVLKERDGKILKIGAIWALRNLALREAPSMVPGRFCIGGARRSFCRRGGAPGPRPRGTEVYARSAVRICRSLRHHVAGREGSCD